MKSNVVKEKIIVVAMSGGVDSSVVAALMQKEGYKVIGVTLQFFDCENISEKRKTCCGSDSKRQVLEVCERLGINHYFLDARDVFEKEVLLPCWEEYSAGRTPNPCVWCNKELKFRFLLNYAKSIGAEGVATGHYAKIAKDYKNGVILRRGIDSNKDQSYFLSLVRKEDLSQAIMPLGDMKKNEVRKLARDFGLSNADKEESQDACLGILGASFAETLRRKFNGEAKKGVFIDDSGKILGKHYGIHNFTIGQRRGFGCGFGKPMFVKRIDATKREVVLCSSEEELFSSKMYVSKINWLMTDFSQKRSFEALVQIRYRAYPTFAKIFQREEMLEVEFYEPQRAVTPGQVAVFYDGDAVIGGGIIQC